MNVFDNFSEGEKAANERYEHGYGPRKFWMDDVKCIYFERALGYCDFPGWGVISKNCDESKIVTLKCKQKASGKVYKTKI